MFEVLYVFILALAAAALTRIWDRSRATQKQRRRSFVAEGDGVPLALMTIGILLMAATGLFLPEHSHPHGSEPVADMLGQFARVASAALAGAGANWAIARDRAGETSALEANA